jgi:competence protein ComFA
LLYKSRTALQFDFGSPNHELRGVIMLAPKYFIYMVTGPGLPPEFGDSSNLRIDAAWWAAKGYQELTFVQPAQAIGTAVNVLGQLQQTRGQLSPRRFFKLTQRLLRDLDAAKFSSYRTQTLAGALTGEAESQPVPDGLERYFWGKCLLGSELVELIRSAGFAAPWNPEDWMQQLVLAGKVTREAAVGYNRWGVPECRRCGATDGIWAADCYFCGASHCLTCSNCRGLGLAKSCMPLYKQSYPESQTPLTPLQPRLDFSLTAAQQRAATELENFIKSNASVFLVWAVCGGGKTEVSFGIIARVLAMGGRVLFAIPRKDVVGELAPRFQKAFPAVPQAALSGGLRRQISDARLVLATTHQCVRFYQSFDLVVLDEADAFPYQGSEMLHQAVRRALKPTGRLVIMSATPDRHTLAQALAGRLPYVSIPARYHRRPLIVPEVIRVKLHFGAQQQWEIPEAVATQLLRTKQLQRKLLVFLPTIRLIETWGAALVRWGRPQGVSGALIHSQSKNAQRNKELLSEGKLDFLVASTILERGITIADLDVMVLDADNERIFDCRTLVQIAGRAGRYGETAQALFYGESVTRSMQECIRWIRQLNLEGAQLGYLDS